MESQLYLITLLGQSNQFMRLFFLYISFLPFGSFAQDTVSVYFEFGSSKVTETYSSMLGDLATKFDFSTIDSIQYIGYTDSVGRIKANERLSLKRAQNVLKASKRNFDAKSDFVQSLYAKGEASGNDDRQNRRVDMVLFWNALEKEEALVEVIENADPKCFFVDIEALSYCHVREVKEKSKTFVFIEALDMDYFGSVKHYFVKSNAGSKSTYQRLKWKKQVTGKLWWKKERYVAKLPKSSYDQFQFFTLADAPCDGCKEDFLLGKDTIIWTVTAPFLDEFLMANWQAKIAFFGQGRAKIRVPKEYVNRAETYYYTSGGQMKLAGYEGVKWETVQWQENKLKSRQPYYYTKLNLNRNHFPRIYRHRRTTICMNPGEGKEGIPFRCRNFAYPVTELQPNMEAGIFRHNDSTTAFVAGGLSHTSKYLYFQIMGGINTHFGFYGYAKGQVHFFSFPFRALSFRNVWATPTTESINKYGRLYFGTELRTSFNQKYQSFLEGNLHLGITRVNVEKETFFPRIYLHGGIARDFSNRINAHYYPFVQMGVIVNLKPIFIRH
ncbi:MAG: OmpA family protein [Crocinitomicaceae bacterium]